MLLLSERWDSRMWRRSRRLDRKIARLRCRGSVQQRGRVLLGTLLNFQHDVRIKGEMEGRTISQSIIPNIVTRRVSKDEE